ncbi:hypothetical protein JCM10021v2_003746 [Rhodotorula toruloides]|uniref:Uncharacterized protein n=1 Tax=Rhodotorula toruloides TaxID=5286 RepID=A0A2T0AEH3_RHOTO|nr:hypothetical protein AAT19DRAFT_13422 [Rhodotorula toruloides]
MDMTHRPQLPPIRSIPCLARHLPPPASPRSPVSIPLPRSKPIEVLDLVDSDSEAEDSTAATDSGRRSSTSPSFVALSSASRPSKSPTQRISSLDSSQRLQSGFVAAPPSGSCVKNRVSTAVEDNSNKRKKRSTASLTPKIRRPPLYRSPPPPVHRPYALPSRAHQQPYAPRSEVISYDSRTPIERGNHPSLAILRRRSDQQACSTSLPTPPLSYFPTQSYA